MRALLALTPMLLAAAAPPAGEAEEIIVISHKLDTIGVNVTRDPKGNFHCSLTDTTGYPKVDEQLCKTTTKCVRDVKWADAAVKACVARRKPALLASVKMMLKERREHGRTGEEGGA